MNLKHTFFKFRAKHNPACEILFQNMAQTADLLDMLGKPGHYTLFAPTNEAFDSLGGDVLERLQTDKEVLNGRQRFYSSSSVTAVNAQRPRHLSH